MVAFKNNLANRLLWRKKVKLKQIQKKTQK